MTATDDLPVTSPGLRSRIHAHLTGHPGLTANEIGRALGLNSRNVLRTLRRMDGVEVVSCQRPRTDGSGRTATVWTAVDPGGDPR